MSYRPTQMSGRHEWRHLFYKGTKKCSKKFAATLQGKSLTRGNVLRIILCVLRRKGVATQFALKTGLCKFVGRKHPSCDVTFSGQNLAQKMPKNTTSHDVLEPLKQVLSASRDVIISGHECYTISSLQPLSTAIGDPLCDS